MKAVSLYAITREQNTSCLQKMERQLSGRQHFLKIREWEFGSMKALADQLEMHMQGVYALRFFYSFQIPKLGKEFDLLQIKEDQIVNIELKSGPVSEEAIRKQLIQNRYYLSVLGKTIRSYTYISSQERLVRLNNHDHIVEADWMELCSDLQEDGADYEGDIEDLFQAELYLISPLTEPDRFLQKEYFLTSQQRDIERQILKRIRAERTGFFWFTGLPGTGKTLLLYDLAMKLSVRHKKVCMIHCGEAGKKWEVLHERLRRIDFLSDSQIGDEGQFNGKRRHEIRNDGLCFEDDDQQNGRLCFEDANQSNGKLCLEEYDGILVDEAHLLTVEKLKILLELRKDQPVIFSSDCEDVISPEEADRSTMQMIGQLPGVLSFHLTNRIRTNAELSSFIQNIMHFTGRKSQKGYPDIAVVYANDEKEVEKLVSGFAWQGYQLVEYPEKVSGGGEGWCREQVQQGSLEEYKSVDLAVSEMKAIVEVLDERYYYDAQGYLRSGKQNADGKSEVRRLFHRLNLAKEKIALVVEGNEKVYEVLLEVVSGGR